MASFMGDDEQPAKKSKKSKKDKEKDKKNGESIKKHQSTHNKPPIVINSALQVKDAPL
jgi:hypothetical protein